MSERLKTLSLSLSYLQLERDCASLKTSYGNELTHWKQTWQIIIEVKWIDITKLRRNSRNEEWKERRKLQSLAKVFELSRFDCVFRAFLITPSLISILSDPSKITPLPGQQREREREREKKNTETSNLTGTTLPTMYQEYQSRVSLMVAVAVTTHREL